MRDISTSLRCLQEDCCSHPRHIHRDICLRARHRRNGHHHSDAAISCRTHLDIGIDLTNSLWWRCRRALRPAEHMNPMSRQVKPAGLDATSYRPARAAVSLQGRRDGCIECETNTKPALRNAVQPPHPPFRHISATLRMRQFAMDTANITQLQV